MIYWMRNKSWYRTVDNAYEYELTDAAPDKARESYAKYKAGVDQALAELDATPYDDVMLDLL
jgi:hypothetical protein